MYLSQDAAPKKRSQTQVLDYWGNILGNTKTSYFCFGLFSKHLLLTLTGYLVLD